MDKKFVILKDEIEEHMASIKQFKKILEKIDANLEEEIKKRTQASVLEDFYMASEKNI